MILVSIGKQPSPLVISYSNQKKKHDNPVMDHKETLTTGTTNDHQYDDQVVLFGAGQ
jgi:hypothetical protein